MKVESRDFPIVSGKVYCKCMKDIHKDADFIGRITVDGRDYELFLCKTCKYPYIGLLGIGYFISKAEVMK